MATSSLRPAGGKRSSKRDKILDIFLRQKGHLSADDLCDLVRREDAGIGRATVYRTLQWMVGAGIARKVDFGEGRSRFEPSYRHPRHFHFVCTSCHRSSEFLSSDIEAIFEEVAAARKFSSVQTLVQISGICEDCRTGTKTVPLGARKAFGASGLGVIFCGRTSLSAEKLDSGRRADRFIVRRKLPNSAGRSAAVLASTAPNPFSSIGNHKTARLPLTAGWSSPPFQRSK